MVLCASVIIYTIRRRVRITYVRLFIFKKKNENKSLSHSSFFKRSLYMITLIVTEQKSIDIRENEGKIEDNVPPALSRTKGI